MPTTGRQGKRRIAVAESVAQFPIQSSRIKKEEKKVVIGQRHDVTACKHRVQTMTLDGKMSTLHASKSGIVEQPDISIVSEAREFSPD